MSKAALVETVAQAVSATAVGRLVVHDFRCHVETRLEISAPTVILTGPNGAGKTSLLEAISLFVSGSGLRRARLGDLARRGPSASIGWSVAARLTTAAGAMDAVLSWNAASGDCRTGERKVLRIDGRTARRKGDLARIFGVAWLTPEMDRLFSDGASARRRFLDRLVFGLDPEHASRLSSYDRTLQQRSMLLRGAAASEPAWLDALEDQLATGGVAIAAARRQVAERLTAACKERGGPFPAATLSAEGPIERWLSERPALAVEDQVRAGLVASRAIDAVSGGAAIGPHRGDLDVRHAATGRPAAACSTGEQKTLLIAIVLAAAWLQARDRGVLPVILLDEVAAHLDLHHRLALFSAVDDLQAQVWYAGTDAVVFSALGSRAQWIRLGEDAVVPDGMVEKQRG